MRNGKRRGMGLGNGWLVALALAASVPATAEKQLLWGDTHLHTNNSFDAYLNQNDTADPATAYRYAQGLPVIHPFHRARIQIETPLDFLVIADHAELLGVMRTTVEHGIPREGLGFGERIRARLAEGWLRGVVEDGEGAAAFTSFLPQPGDPREAAANSRLPSPIPNSERIERSVWVNATNTADAFNDPGRFTTLIGWEWSSLPAGANLHRVVFTSASAELAQQFRPMSSADSMYPEDLWSWLDETTQATGAEFVAIPHNSNISKGIMFAETTLRGNAYDEAMAAKRMRWEPVAEITQFKGDSETHPALSPDDPFADYEEYPYYIQQTPEPYAAQPGDYLRTAWLRGLELEGKSGGNPYRMGVIGATDAHTGVASAEEPNFWGKMATDSIPENKGLSRRGPGLTGWSMGAAGLAGVWATENTREALLEAFRRKEVYGTTGPRIAVRVAGGFDLDGDDLEALLAGDAVPMGGDLRDAPSGATPQFRVQALQDPKSAPLDRVQIIKGWVDASGKAHERIHDVVWSGDRTPAADGVVPALANTVDPTTGRYDAATGAGELAALWSDPDFDASQDAFYYVRVLEIPTPRHSLLDAIALGIDPAETGHPTTLQERAYTSPIWYRAPRP
ncbi:MAG: DUF3604 domain-containing protein [Myxococcota bacterium]